MSVLGVWDEEPQALPDDSPAMSTNGHKPNGTVLQNEGLQTEGNIR